MRTPLARAITEPLAAAAAPIIGLLIVIVLFSWVLPLCGIPMTGFMTVLNLKTVAVQAVIVSLAALGATAVIIAGGIDLSCGSVVALCSVLFAYGLDERWAAGLGPAQAPLLMLVAILAGLIAGTANGLVVVWLKLPPFIVTLGTMGIVRGIAGLIARNNAIQPYEIVQATAPWINDLGSPQPSVAWLFVSPSVWAVPLLAIFMAILLCRTTLGRYIFAVGSNETAARLSGVNVNQVKIFVYALAGLASGLAGAVQFARTTVGDPTARMGLELYVIAAVVIGGASLSGGRGSVLGTVLGAFLMSLLQNACTKAGLDVQVQNIIVGLIIISAAALDRLRNREYS